MSEIEARAPPTRGRSSMRGGRGGFGRGGARGGRKAPNGTSHDAMSIDESLDDQGELGEMKKKYSSELGMLKDMFPDWTDVDLVFALDEADGDLPSTVDMITEGNVSQFAEVKKPKDRARSKAADGPSTAGAQDKPAFAARGGRGRGGIEGSRGRGGRGSDRARGGFRGGRGGHATTNGAPKDVNTASVPTTESSAWDTPQAAAETGTSAWDTTPADSSKDVNTTGSGAWGTSTTTEATPVPTTETGKSSVATDAPAPKKSWASMFAQPKPAPVAIPKPAPKPALQAPVTSTEPAPAAAEPEVKPTETPQDNTAQAVPAPVTQEPVVETPTAAPEPAVQTPQSVSSQAAAPATPHEPLTQENVEHLPDDSHPPSTFTTASTVGSSDPRNLTPVPGQQPPIGRPAAGGFATSAQRAATTGGRSASFQRRVQEQQEAVVMPGHNAVDRAAVQFGSMGLNGEPGPDVDEEREEPETRQAPQHSPPTQPKASLPTAPRQTMPVQEPTAPSAPEALPTPKQAPGLGPASQQNQPQNQLPSQEPALGQGLPQEPTHLGQNYNQYAAYGQAGMQDGTAPQQKPYDPFSHQAQAPYDRFGTQPQQPSHSGFGGLSSAPSDYSSYYTADPQRNAYSGYYGTSAGYAPQDMRAQTQQDAGLSQQRSASGFGAASNDSAFGAQAQQQVGHRFRHQHSRQAKQGCDQRYRTALRRTEAELNPDGQLFNRTTRGLNARRTRMDNATTRFALNSPKVSLSDIHSQQTQSRYGETPGSGHTTPNPIAAAAQQQNVPTAPQSQHPMHQAPSHHQQQAAYGGFPYGHPYYNSPYQQAYQNQFGYGNPASAYGGYQGKQGGMYGGPYGSSYDQHSSSPANVGAFTQNQQASMRSASGMGSNLGGSGFDDYGRSSAQTASLNQTSGFGGMTDPFARSTSGFGQTTYAAQPSMTATAQDDSLKPFGDSKSGPSPSLGQPGRPGSAANSVVGSSQTSVPQQQQQQQPQQNQSSFGGYGGFPSQSGQYGGLGGLGGQQGGMGGQGGYGAYGAGAFGQYGGYGSRGGWGQTYGAH